MWTLDSDSGVLHWRWVEPDPGATLLFSTRLGGISAPPYDSMNLGLSTADSRDAVLENRRLLLTAAGLDPDTLATAGQVHGARVVEAIAPGHHPECDGLITRVPGLALAVTTADCMSLLYSAPGAVGVAHAGWRGTADGMPVATLRALCGLAHCAPSDIQVHFGPCIRGCCYEVGDEVASRFIGAAVRPGVPRPHLDLPTAARAALLEAGVPADSIHDTGACTHCEPHRYFSYRQDAGVTGRMWGVVALRGQ